MFAQKFKHGIVLTFIKLFSPCVNAVEQVTAQRCQNSPSTFQPPLPLLDHRNAVGQATDFDQFSLDSSKFMPKFAERSANVVQHLKQIHTCLPLFEKSAPRSATARASHSAIRMV